MWDFPSTGAFIYNNLFGIFGALVLFCISLFCWKSFFVSIKYDTKESGSEFLKNLLGAVFPFLISFFISFSLISDYTDTGQCRNLDLQNVKAIRVTKMPSEDSFDSKTILFNDSNKIHEGLTILKNVNSRDRKKDKFVYGYRIQLILENNSAGPISLYYFPETLKSENVEVIIPQCGIARDGFGKSDDIYASPEFGDWLRENVEPLLKEVK